MFFAIISKHLVLFMFCISPQLYRRTNSTAPLISLLHFCLIQMVIIALWFQAFESYNLKCIHNAFDMLSILRQQEIRFFKIKGKARDLEN